jgi:RNA polymerase sigma-70 factor (ECF subfamily)
MSSTPLDLGALFRQHASYVLYTLRRLGVPARDLPDVAHDVFLQIHRRRETYDPARPIRPWLFAFSFRVAAQYRRLSRNRHELLEPPPDRPDPEPDAGERLAREQDLELAFQALASLELTRRAVFILHELDGCPIPEVATALGIPVNTAYSRLRLARGDFHEAAQRLRLRRGGP